MTASDDLPAETDVVVVGGGVMGTATAFFLSRAGEDVVLFERDRLAAGSTGDSSAILRHHYGDEAIYTDLARWSHEFYRRFEAETGAPIAHAESPLVRFADEGTPGGAYAMAGYEVLSDRDLPVSRYDGAQLRERYPMYDGAAAYDFAVSDDAAAYSDGSDVAQGFARGATDRGASVHTGVAVESIETDAGRVTGVRTDAGTVACESVVVAAGPWTPELAETVGVDVPIEPVREQILLLDPPADYAERYPDLTPTTSLPGGQWYVRPDVGGGVLVATHRHDEPTDPDEYDDSPDEETVLELVETLAEHVPGLADAGIKGSYCGVYSTTPDHDFVIDAAGPAGCFWCCGFSGHGFKHGPAVGKLTAGMVCGEDPTFDGVEIDRSYFSLDRFDDTPDGNGRPDDYI
ncbi:NAD(P)/FAD-dependent oxidoreductase [Halovivax gelatinilyticus]|uniref:NAD(P)/FAD-dependent oxidoreductase n=1 Tax=Halovivax gelatinilyticus TaxID=2961597 RepID=UPI0020CA2A0C|nr:FAD-dependent oxidoreductase [Halovivax gelatinilyticus]